MNGKIMKEDLKFLLGIIVVGWLLIQCGHLFWGPYAWCTLKNPTRLHYMTVPIALHMCKNNQIGFIPWLQEEPK